MGSLQYRAENRRGTAKLIGDLLPRRSKHTPFVAHCRILLPTSMQRLSKRSIHRGSQWVVLFLGLNGTVFSNRTAQKTDAQGCRRAINWPSRWRNSGLRNGFSSTGCIGERPDVRD